MRSEESFEEREGGGRRDAAQGASAGASGEGGEEEGLQLPQEREDGRGIRERGEGRARGRGGSLSAPFFSFFLFILSSLTFFSGRQAHCDLLCKFPRKTPMTAPSRGVWRSEVRRGSCGKGNGPARRPQNSRFWFSFSCAHSTMFLLLLVEFWWCFKALGSPTMHVWSSLEAGLCPLHPSNFAHAELTPP